MFWLQLQHGIYALVPGALDAGGPSPAGGTRIIEIWESEADSQKFLNEILKPNLPAGVVPDST